MGDWALLLTAVGGILGSLLTGSAAVITALRASPRERKQAARGALGRLAEAAKDGTITPEELADVFRDDQEEGEEP
ncbi:MAG: hypothetical protein ABIQ18_41225 [Umezawaea sp.]